MTSLIVSKKAGLYLAREFSGLCAVMPLSRRRGLVEVSYSSDYHFQQALETKKNELDNRINSFLKATTYPGLFAVFNYFASTSYRAEY